MTGADNKLRGIWWNVWYDARDRQGGAHAIAKRITELIKTHNPDWICLQEAFSYQKYAAMGDLDILIKKATGWNGYFVADREYLYRSSNSHNKFHFKQGMAIYSKWPITRSSAHILGTIPRSIKKGSSREHIIEVDLRTSQGMVTVANTHWTKMSIRFIGYRKEQMRNFKRHISNRAPEHPYIVGGDFNTLEFHPTIRQLSGLLDLRTSPGKQPTWRHFGKQHSLFFSNIDYVGVFRDGKVTLHDIQQLDRPPSDHTPMLASFSIL